MSEPNDRDLAARAGSGDALAFRLLLARHYDRIFRLAWRLTGTRVDAEDVAQEVCVKLATAVRAYRGEADVATWIWRITYNAATDVLRQRQRITPVAPSDMLMLAEGPAEDTPGHDTESRQLWAQVARLPRQQRDAVMLVYGEEMSHAAAASVMGCSEKTVSWHIHEAKKRLKSLLEPAA